MITILTKNKMKGSLLVNKLSPHIQIAGVETTISNFIKRNNYLRPNQILIDTTDFKLIDMLTFTIDNLHFNPIIILDTNYIPEAFPLFIRAGARKITYNNEPITNLITLIKAEINEPAPFIELTKPLQLSQYFTTTTMYGDTHYNELFNKYIRSYKRKNIILSQKEQEKIKELIKQNIFPDSPYFFESFHKKRPHNKRLLTNYLKNAIIQKEGEKLR